MKTTIEQQAAKTFSRYGTDLRRRFIKLQEEVVELQEAIEIYEHSTDPQNREENLAKLHDELSDVQSVVSHIAAITNIDFETLLMNAIIKNEVRVFYPSYKRITKKIINNKFDKKTKLCGRQHSNSRAEV